MVRKYVKVLNLMQSKGGRIDINDPELAAVMGNLTEKHIPSLMWRIRTHAGLLVRGIRVGRKIVTYELVAVVSPVVADVAPDVPVVAEVVSSDTLTLAPEEVNPAA